MTSGPKSSSSGELSTRQKKLRKTIMPHSRNMWPSKEAKPIYPPISLFWKDLSLLIFSSVALCIVLLVLDNIGSAQEMCEDAAMCRGRPSSSQIDLQLLTSSIARQLFAVLETMPKKSGFALNA